MDETITLGKLIEELERQYPEAPVTFDFCNLTPTTVDSWRGQYYKLALGFTDSSACPTVAELLVNLREAIGKTFTGWKGGQYVMDADTEVWVDNPGRFSTTRIVGVEEISGTVTIKTKGE